MSDGEHLSADSWEEMYKLIVEKMPKNCISCRWGNNGKIDENASKFIFCTHPNVVCMVDLTFMQGCGKFEKEDSDENLELGLETLGGGY